MSKSPPALVLLALALGTLGCSLFIPATPTPLPLASTEAPPGTAAPALPTPAPATEPPAPPTEPVAAPTKAPTTPAPASLTAQQLKNAEYELPQYGRTVTLADGLYESGSSADYIYAKMLDQVAFGDLNGDGADDAAVMLAESGGGSGTFVSVIVMLNQDGRPVQSSSTLIDDRPIIESISIDNGQIVVGATIHGTDDPGCCPNFPVIETYAWTPSHLDLAHFSSTTPNGAKRDIQIERPTPGVEASGSLRVQGSFTISPFENTLTYRLLDEQGAQVAAGPIAAQSDGLGGPGTFDGTIDLAGLPSGSTVRVQIVDVSAADGSTLALDSVAVVLK